MRPPENESAWERLGRLLAGRRVQLEPRYRNKNLFARERQINRRMLWRIETGADGNYGNDTLRAVEASYMLVPGSIGRTLAGGPLEPLPEPAAPPLRAVPAAPRGSGTGIILRDLLSRHPELAQEILRDLVADYPDDPALQALAAQTAKKAQDRVTEILDWFDFLASRQGNASAGLQGDEHTSVTIACGNGNIDPGWHLCLSC